MGVLAGDITPPLLNLIGGNIQHCRHCRGAGRIIQLWLNNIVLAGVSECGVITSVLSTVPPSWRDRLPACPAQSLSHSPTSSRLTSYRETERPPESLSFSVNCRLSEVSGGGRREPRQAQVRGREGSHHDNLIKVPWNYPTNTSNIQSTVLVQT